MRFLLTLFLCLSLCTGLSAQPGAFSFETKEQMLKNLKADDIPTEVVYKFKNTGKQPILISRIVPNIPRLKVDWEKSPIAPGASSEIRVSFSTLEMPETFQYNINIYSNAREPREQIRIGANITDNPDKPALLYKYDLDGIKFKTASINLNNIYADQIARDTICFFNTRQEAVRVSAKYVPSHIKLEFMPQEVKAGEKGTLLLTYDPIGKNDYGYTFDNIILNFNEDASYRNRLSVSAKIVENFSKLTPEELANAPRVSLDKKEAEFGKIKQGEKVDIDFTIRNTGKSGLIIRKTKTSCGCTAVTLGENTIAPGQSTTIRVSFNSAGKLGRQYKTVTVITNDPENPETQINITGDILPDKEK